VIPLLGILILRGEAFILLLNHFKKHYKAKSFSYKEAIDFGFKSSQFYRLVEEGVVERFARGHYRLSSYFPESYEKQFSEYSKLINEKSAICLGDALSYHQLSDEIVTTPIILVDHGTKTNLKTIRLYRARNPKWEIGINKKKGFWVTSVERSIVESMIHTDKAGREGYTALKKAIFTKKTSIFKIIKIAEELGYKKRLAPYFEVFI